MTSNEHSVAVWFRVIFDPLILWLCWNAALLPLSPMIPHIGVGQAYGLWFLVNCLMPNRHMVRIVQGDEK